MFTMESSGPCFNSYMCGECFRCNSPRRVQGRFNSYMRGECFGIRALSRRTHGVSTHICAGNVSGRRSCFGGATAGGFNSYMCGECFTFQTPLALPGFRFNSYMCGECFKLVNVEIRTSALVVSTHICAGNVSAFMRGFAILDGANPQEFDCSLRVRTVIYRMR